MMSNIETVAPSWMWNPNNSDTEMSDDRLKIVDAGKGKAWTTAISPDISINNRSNCLYYYEIKIDFCNASNSIKIVFGIMSEDYMAKVLSITRGLVGSLRGSCPFGYFKEFGIGSLCYFANGSIVKDGIILEKVSTYTTNDRIGMLVDTSNNCVAFFKNSKLESKFINIYSSFKSQSTPPTTTTTNTNTTTTNTNIPQTRKPFLIYPSVSLIKQNSITIIENPTIPAFEYEDNIISQSLEQLTLINKNNSNNITTTSTNNNVTTTTTKSSSSPKLPTQSPVNNNKTTTTTTTSTQSPTTSIKPATIINTTATATSSGNGGGKEDGLPDPNNNCPVCGISFKSIGKDWTSINKHIDECLTFNLLDKETIDPKSKNINIKCPYSGCKKSLTTIDFINHCNEKHLLDDNHNYKCPLCNEKSQNLISHLSKAHIKVQPKQVGVAYSTSILENDLGDQECPICLEEFYKDQSVARLECWCIFHIDCISSYLIKSKKCPVHN